MPPVSENARLSTISEVSEYSESNELFPPAHSFSFIKYQREAKSCASIVEWEEYSDGSTTCSSKLDLIKDTLMSNKFNDEFLGCTFDMLKSSLILQDNECRCNCTLF
ncbi:unnamed protein product [Blepharisma stoltei]|uniref:Uncharacterized protein n=1 Tax=Blepharisma stoltei TaxID=1481888 RepID=A0AAU9J3T4_9CILI|nr:unnamed protein product [Blepharisma stoltei]